MRKALGEVLSVLREPDVTSSVVPLIIVIGVFLAISTALILYILRQLRAPEQEPEVPAELDLEPTVPTDLGHPEPALIVSSSKERIKKFISTWVRLARRTDPTENLSAPDISEISIPPLESSSHGYEVAALRVRIERLEIENFGLRDQNALSLNRIEELKQEVARLEKLRLQDAELLRIANEKRGKAQTRVEEIEVQLHELIEEVERLYKANAQAENLRSASRLEGIVQDLESHGHSPEQTPPPAEVFDLRKKVETQSTEIEQLKRLLLICREQIVLFTQRPPSSRPLEKV